MALGIPYRLSGLSFLANTNRRCSGQRATAHEQMAGPSSFLHSSNPLRPNAPLSAVHPPVHEKEPPGWGPRPAGQKCGLTRRTIATPPPSYVTAVFVPYWPWHGICSAFPARAENKPGLLPGSPCRNPPSSGGISMVPRVRSRGGGHQGGVRLVLVPSEQLPLL